MQPMEKNVEKQLVVRTFEPDMNALKQTAKQLAHMQDTSLNLYGQAGEVLIVVTARAYAQAAATELTENVAEQFHIETVTVDLTGTKEALTAAVTAAHPVAENAAVNIAPRLRMATLYAVAQTRGALVAGTGNRSERYLGYFTKWGDGACDVNPIADLTVREVYKLLRYLRAPEPIINKQPSAGLFEGQTDEAEMGVAYADVDDALLCGAPMPERAQRMHAASAHKLRMPLTYGEDEG